MTDQKPVEEKEKGKGKKLERVEIPLSTDPVEAVRAIAKKLGMPEDDPRMVAFNKKHGQPKEG